MIKKMLYRNRKSIYIFIIFFVITIFMALSISTIQSAINDSLILSDLTSKNAIIFDITDENNITSSNLLTELNKHEKIYFEKRGLNPGAFNGKAIYFKNFEGIEEKYPIIKGGFFTEKNFKDNVPLAMVGKNIYDRCVEINGDKYFQYNSINYKVIGIMGYKERNSRFDGLFLINLNSYLSDFNNIKNSDYLFDCKNNTRDNFKKLTNACINIDKNIHIREKSLKNNDILSETFIESFQSLALILVLIAIIFLNTFNICSSWVLSKSREISIKKALGGTDFKIILELVNEYLKITFAACICGSLIYFIIIKLNLISLFNGQIYFIGYLTTFVIINLLGLISILIPCGKILNIKPALGMKGR